MNLLKKKIFEKVFVPKKSAKGFFLRTSFVKKIFTNSFFTSSILSCNDHLLVRDARSRN